MLFSPAGNTLYFLSVSGRLYGAQAPDWSPMLLAAGLTIADGGTDMAWWVGE